MVGNECETIFCFFYFAQELNKLDANLNVLFFEEFPIKPKYFGLEWPNKVFFFWLDPTIILPEIKGLYVDLPKL